MVRDQGIHQTFHQPLGFTYGDSPEARRHGPPVCRLQGHKCSDDPCPVLHAQGGGGLGKCMKELCHILTKGFYQVPMHPADVPKTVFVCHKGKYNCISDEAEKCMQECRSGFAMLRRCSRSSCRVFSNIAVLFARPIWTILCFLGRPCYSY